MGWGAAIGRFNLIGAVADYATGQVNKKAEKEAGKYKGGKALLKGLKVAQFVGKHMDSGESKRKSDRDREHVTRERKHKSHAKRRERYDSPPPQRVHTSRSAPITHDRRFRHPPQRKTAPRASQYQEPQYYERVTTRHSIHRPAPPPKPRPRKSRSGHDIDHLTRSMGGLGLDTRSHHQGHRPYPRQPTPPIRTRYTRHTIPVSVPRTRYVYYRA